ncbi:MAG: exosortase C-terminal domain/associated protein EpsI, partial [Pseudomonadota bacterium]
MIARDEASRGGVAVRTIVVSAVMALVAAASAIVAPPSREIAAAPDLERLLPDAFGAWRRIPLQDTVLPPETNLSRGEAVAYRAYRDDLGRVVTLVAAYGPPLGDSVRLHRPEKCYAAQGFLVKERAVALHSTFQACGAA